MSTVDHERWERIIDREMLGEPVSADDRAFADQFEANHPECARERDGWDDMLEHLGTQPPAGLSNRDLTNEVLARKRVPETDVGVRAAVLVGGAGLAAAAALALAFVAPSAPPMVRISDAPVSAPAVTPLPHTTPPRTTPTESTLATAQVVLTSSGSLTIDGRAAGLGDTLRPGMVLETRGFPACVRQSKPFVAACVAPDTEVAVASWAGGQHELTLARGSVLAILDKLPSEQRFGVSTVAGTVTAVGTVFAVEVAGDGVTSTAVIEGVVRVEAGQARHDVHARERATLGQAPTGYDPAESPTVVPVRLASLWRDVPSSRLTLATDPAGASVAVDGIDLGGAPMAVALAPGDYDLEISTGDVDPIVDHVELRHGDTLDRTYVLEETSSRATTRPQVPLAELQRRARDARAAGRWRETERLYREIIRGHRGTSEAHVTRVALGDLLLDDLGDPRGALRAYDAYLRRGGSVALEARLGRIRALRKLGRTEQELRAIDEFVARHPRSMRSRDLENRASSVRGAR